MADLKADTERLIVELDQLDDEILRLLERRAQTTQRIGTLRQSEGEGELVQLARRDQHTMDRVADGAKGTLTPEAARAVFREILSACRALASSERVLYLGPEAGFCEMAALARFGRSSTMAAAASIPQIFDDVERRRADYGVVPLESSSEGVVHQTLDLLIQAPLAICGDMEIETALHLLSKTGNISDVEKVYGHSGSLAQCRRTLEEQMSKASLIDVRSMALAAQLASEDHGGAAIGTSLSAERFGLQVSQAKMEDVPSSWTRFIVIGRLLPRPTGRDKTTIVFSTKDGPGALYEALRPFADRGINLTKIESRPARTNLWDYVFFMDVDGHITDRGVTSAVEDAKRVTRFVKVLGSYPKR